jgi:hypothetical protein
MMNGKRSFNYWVRDIARMALIAKPSLAGDVRGLSVN